MTRDNFVQRANSFEVCGIDILIDKNDDVHIIDFNPCLNIQQNIPKLQDMTEQMASSLNSMMVD